MFALALSVSNSDLASSMSSSSSTVGFEEEAKPRKSDVAAPSLLKPLGEHLEAKEALVRNEPAENKDMEAG